VRLVEPVSYIKFMSLVVGAAAVITDSGGVQEETTYLGIPCLTLRENTERPITISQGTNRLSRADTLLADLRDSLARRRAGAARPEHWDGRTAQRCVDDLRRRS
jgi:UDP-N-acetylglucosamine 2-epimerase (non-hydrolysing)